MAASESTKTTMEDEEFKQFVLSLPKQQWFGLTLHFYQSFWCTTRFVEPIITFQTHFQAHDTDIITASLPKTGTTWSKSLLFTILNRKKFSDFSQHPLHTNNPHELVPHFEINCYKKLHGNQPDFTELPSPRLFGTHIPYKALPDSIKSSKCLVVYICRNPLDTFVSLWHFSLQVDGNKNIKPNMEMMEEHVANYGKGITPYGPYDEHLLGYWKASLQNPQKVLFLEYEGLKKEPKLHVKRLADFLGCPFSEEEEKGNVIEEIIELCSLKSLKEMEVNKSGKFFAWYENKSFFRKGEVGDWNNDLTPEMAKSIHQIQDKLKKDGFSFTYYQSNM